MVIKLKEIIKKYNYQLKIILIYTVCLSIVYGSTSVVLIKRYAEKDMPWVGAVSAILIFLIGIVVAIVYVLLKEKKEKRDELVLNNVENVSETINQENKE